MKHVDKDQKTLNKMIGPMGVVVKEQQFMLAEGSHNNQNLLMLNS